MAYPTRSPRDETTYNALNRNVGSIAASDARGQLHRRFTTNNMPTVNNPLSPIGQQRRQAAEPAEFTTATYHKLQVLEKKKLEYEYLKEQRRRFEAEMELIDLQSRRGEEEIQRLSSEVRYSKPTHSQPTTPPEYSDGNGFPTALSRPNRFSMSALPSNTASRSSRTNSQMTSPPGSFYDSNNLPSQSMPGTRRNSDEDNDDFDHEEFTPLSPVARKNNRMSMPVTNLDLRGRSDLPDLASVLGHIDTTAYLFGEADKEHSSTTSNDNKAYFQMSNTKDEFPILVRRDGAGNMTKLSASSAALDLAQAKALSQNTQSHNWQGSGHRHSQPSLPANTLRNSLHIEDYEVIQSAGNVETTPTKSMAHDRRSVEFNLSPMNIENKRASYTGPSSTIPKLTQSYSANDISTLKNGGGASSATTLGFKSHAEQYLHNHNASLGRIPPNTLSNRHSREFPTSFKEQEYRAPQSNLHTSTTSFGASATATAPVSNVNSTISSPTSGVPQYSTSNANMNVNNSYYGYGVSMLNGAMSSMSLGQVPQPSGPTGYGGNAYSGSLYNPYAAYGPSGRVQDSQARVIQSRRLQNDANRFMNYDLKTMPRHEIYSLCKDQHGCRFLQKKLEERNPEHIQIIFDETCPHVVELMTDPFGNYLCQKLLEYCNDEQRNSLVRNATPAMVSIALNQHGTRALQKMIEFISTDEQTQMIIQALSGQVVDLIQDLNGNHVIQKCLNHLKSSEAQFIFDAVGEHCVTVGTHRHGCCVLQRCIDHASGFQKVDLVRKITAHSIHLVQDPFGNYVVQYILDLNDHAFTGPMCHGFQGKITELSKQKFSSNVIEKCIRCADMASKAMMIEELLNVEELEKLMRDSYGNYVIQTALEFAPPELCLLLIDSMRPILPAIRQTPYGRRIMSKVQEREGRLAAFAGRGAPGQESPHNPQPAKSCGFTGQASVPCTYQSTSSVPYQPPMYTATANYGSNIAAPQPHRLSNPPLPKQLHNSVNGQSYQQYAPPSNMGNFF